MITTFIENSNHKNSKTFIVKTNFSMSQLCKNKLNFSAVKFFDNNGNVLENNVKRVVFCCKYSDEKFHSGINTEKEYIEYNDKRVYRKKCKHSWKLSKSDDHIHNFGNGKQYYYRCMFCRRTQKRDYQNPHELRVKWH